MDKLFTPAFPCSQIISSLVGIRDDGQWFLYPLDELCSVHQIQSVQPNSFSDLLIAADYEGKSPATHDSICATGGSPLRPAEAGRALFASLISY